MISTGSLFANIVHKSHELISVPLKNTTNCGLPRIKPSFDALEAALPLYPAKFDV